MSPEGVLLETIAVASLYGDSAYLRESQCEKLRESIEAELRARNSVELAVVPGLDREKGDENLKTRRN